MDETPHARIILPALGISIILVASLYAAFRWSKNQKSAIVLPGGVTYLGPSPTPVPKVTKSNEGKIIVPTDIPWEEYLGKQYHYTFSYPTNLSLGVFPNDPYDSVTLFYPGSDVQTNLFLRVDNLTLLNKSAYIGKPMEYARVWWQDYSWKGISSITPFENSHGLKGYRAQYADEKGNTPYDHIFFAVPDHPDLVIWLSGRLFTQDVFDRIVDSVTWTN